MTRRAIPVPLGGASYEVLVGAGLLDNLAALLAERCPAESYTVITDSTVAPLYGRRVADLLARNAPTIVLTFPAGEWNKTRETWAALTDGLLKAGVGRDGAVVALGGGVAGDLAGFVAATYLRGIAYVQVPTSLLAMIDSAIGGKTGVDTAFGKNLVGAFHQPRAVVADVATLATLPPVQLAAGMAEALKHGIIADAGYFTRLLDARDRILEADPAALEAVVRGSVTIKAAIVAQDERERGRRATLNFGHTVAHALEATLGYEILHGEAVALGMLAEARLGEKLGITAAEVPRAVADALERFALPTSAPAAVDPERALEAMGHDKKKRRGTVRFALPARLGEMAGSPAEGWTVAIPEEAVRHAIAGLG